MPMQTVSDLIARLQVLPPETPLCEKTWCTNEPTDYSSWMEVYQKDGELRLYGIIFS